MTIPDINKASMENLCLPTFKSFSSIGDMKFKAITAGPRGERCASVHTKINRHNIGSQNGKMSLSKIPD